MVQRFVALGECMIELSQAGNGLLRQGFAGDTLNTAWYARALLPAAWAVDYATVLGHDPASDQMLAELAAAGIGTGRIARHPTRVPGLYLISLSEGANGRSPIGAIHRRRGRWRMMRAGWHRSVTGRMPSMSAASPMRSSRPRAGPGCAPGWRRPGKTASG